MTNAGLRARPRDCLSDLRMDLLLAGDLAAPTAASARAHLASCPACTRRWQEIVENHRECAEDRSLDALVDVPDVQPAGARWRRWLFPAGALAAAAVAAVLVLISRPDDDRGTRTKGNSKLGFYVKHGESVRLGGSEERVNPGDVIRFAYSTATPRHVAVVGVDASRKATIYVPMALMEPGQDVELPRSTLLDETLGPELVYGLFCAEPIELEPLRRALEAHADPPAFPESCEVDKIVLVKVRP